MITHFGNIDTSAVWISWHTEEPRLPEPSKEISSAGYARLPVYGVASRHWRNVSAKGARGRKARWAIRHALNRKRRRRPHPMREVRAAQRFIRHYDQLERAGALWILGGEARRRFDEWSDAQP